MRLGVVFRGRILHERVLDRRMDVTVGRAPGCTVQLEQPGFPDKMTLLIHEKNRYYLVVPEAKEARINLRGGAADTGSVNTDQVENKRGLKAIPVDQYTGGSVSLGELTLLFQFVRADTVPTTTIERSVLRLGLVTQDRLIADTIFPDKKVVTVGSDKNDTMVLPDDEYNGAPAIFTKVGENTVTARFAAKTPVRLSLGEEPMDIEKAISTGRAKKVAGDVEVTLPLNSRGRATMGPYTILFQVVRQRITVSTFQKKGPAKAFMDFFMTDVVWTCSLLLAFLIGISLVAEALIWQERQGKYQREMAKAEETARQQFLEVEVEAKEEPKPEPKVDEAPILSNAAKEEAKKVEDAKPDKKKDKEKAVSLGQKVIDDPETHKAKVRDNVAKQSVIAGLQGGALGGGTKLFSTGGPGGGGEVVARDTAFGGGAGPGTGPGEGGGVALGSPNLGGGSGSYDEGAAGRKDGGGFKRKQDVVDKSQKAPEKRLSLDIGAFGGSGSDQTITSAVKAKVGAKASAVKNCYEKVLRTKPNVAGKVTVSFTLGTAGRVTSANVSAPDGELQACIKARFEEIVVTVPVSSPQKFTQTYVFSKN